MPYQMINGASRFERLPFNTAQWVKKCAGSRRPSRRSKNPQKLSSSISSRTRIFAPFTPSESQSCKKTFNWPDEYAACGEAQVGYDALSNLIEGTGEVICMVLRCIKLHWQAMASRRYKGRELDDLLFLLRWTGGGISG